MQMGYVPEIYVGLITKRLARKFQVESYRLQRTPSAERLQLLIPTIYCRREGAEVVEIARANRANDAPLDSYSLSA